MDRSKSRVFGVTAVGAVGALVLAGVGSPVSAAAAARDITPPLMWIRHVGDPQQYGSASVTLSIRCFGGALAKPLTVKITQGQVTGEQSEDRDDIICDGVRRDVHAFPYSDDGADFVGGPATVTARLTVVDPQTMKPLPEVVATQSVYLRPFVTVRIAKGPVRLNANGSAVIRASIKCLNLYQVTGFYVSASQNGGRVSGRGNGDAENPPCDGTFREHKFIVTPNQPFVPGTIVVTVVGGVSDADTYDPVDGATVVGRRHAVRSGC